MTPHKQLNRLRIVMITDIHYWFSMAGNQQRIFSMVQYLQQQGHEVSVITPNAISLKDAQQICHIQHKVIPLKHLTENKLINRLKNRLKDLLVYGDITSLAHRLKFTNSPAQHSELEAYQQVLSHIDPDVIITEYIHLDRFTPESVKNVYTIIDTHDIMHKRMEDLWKDGLKPPPWLQLSKSEEKKRLNRFHSIIAISPEDKQSLTELHLGHKTIVCPHPLNVRSELPPSPTTSTDWLFIGSSSPHNIIALNWLCDEIWPRVRERIPQANCFILGQIVDKYPHLPNGFTKIGPVKQTETWYDRCVGSINPVKTGSGLKIKSIEAINNISPIVTTPQGASGLEDFINSGIEIAQISEEFVEKVYKISTNPQKARETLHMKIKSIHRNYTAEACYEELFDTLAALQSRKDAFNQPR